MKDEQTFMGHPIVGKVRYGERSFPVCLVTCRECKRSIERGYHAIMAAERRGKGCICIDCQPRGPLRKKANRLDPHREMLIEKHTGDPPESSAMRALLGMANDDEPLRISQSEFWDVMRARLINARRGVSKRTADKYLYRVRKVMGIGVKAGDFGEVRRRL